MRRPAALLSAVLLSLCLLAGNVLAAPDAVQFAKSVVTKLTKGDQSAAASIDFDHLKGFGTDAGAMYRTMPTAADKAAFRKSFIQSFSRSFNNTGARAASLKNWRLVSKQGNTSVVATTGLNGKSMLITVSTASGTMKLIDMEPAK